MCGFASPRKVESKSDGQNPTSIPTLSYRAHHSHIRCQCGMIKRDPSCFQAEPTTKVVSNMIRTLSILHSFGTYVPQQVYTQSL